MASASTYWKSLLLDEVSRMFGRSRAVANAAQIQHMAEQLALLDDWVPAGYPDHALSDPSELAANDVDEDR